MHQVCILIVNMNLDPWQVRDKPARGSTKKSGNLTHCDPSSLSHHQGPWVEFCFKPQVCWCTKSSLHWHNQVPWASRLIGCASLNIAWRWCTLSFDDALLHWQYDTMKWSNVEREDTRLVQNIYYKYYLYSSNLLYVLWCKCVAPHVFKNTSDSYLLDGLTRCGKYIQSHWQWIAVNAYVSAGSSTKSVVLAGSGPLTVKGWLSLSRKKDHPATPSYSSTTVSFCCMETVYSK